ncbi:MAG TPA: carbohydrate ABC transporter permease [Clostridia bacterium]|nr:carbohydrate ABC transporter permease [Clostridia bacterium]
MKTRFAAYRRRSPGVFQITINAAFLIYSAICLGPLLLVLGCSLSRESDVLSSGYRLIPLNFTTDAYRFLLGNGRELFQAYFYTVFSTIAGTALGVIIMAALAYPMSRKDFRPRNKFSFYVYLTMLFNGGMVPLYLVYTQLIPIKNSILALILPNMLGGFYTLLMKNFFAQNIPESVVESAEIDGATTYRIFFTMVLPLSKPVLVTVGLFSAIAYWNDFFRNMLLANNGIINNLQYLLYRITVQIQVINQNPDVAASFPGGIPNETARMAMAILVVIPIAVLFPLIQKHFVRGLVAGAVKG